MGRIALELLPTSLASVLHTKDPPGWWNSTAKSIVAAGAAIGMRFAHEQGVEHRDPTPSNILLDEMHRPRTSGFGARKTSMLSKKVSVGI